MDIVKSAGLTLFDDNIKDLSLDCIEIGIDSIVDNELIKELPIIKTIYSITKVSMAVREKFFLKKFLAFIYEFNNGNAKEAEILKRKNAIKNNESWIFKEIEFLVIYMENMDSDLKAKVLAVLYGDYINDKIAWDRFTQYTEIINRMFSNDMTWLTEFYEYSQKNGKNNKGLSYDLTAYSRLIGLGLMEREIDLGNKKYVFVEDSYGYRITYSGKYVAEAIERLAK